MLTSTFFGNRAIRKTREAQGDATKASRGLERLLELESRGESVTTEKSVQALDNAIVKLGILKSRTAKYEELRMEEEQLQKVVEEKQKDNRKRVDDLTKQIGLVNEHIDQLLTERESLHGQIIAANADFNADEMERRQTLERAQHSDADNQRSKSAVISDYCDGDWDDTIDDDLADQ